MGQDTHEQAKESRDGTKHYKSKARGRAEFVFYDTNRFVALLSTITDYGGAVRIGRSRDGGVLALGIYGTSEGTYTVYCHSGNEMVECLEAALDDFRAQESRIFNARKVLSAAQG